MHPYNHAESSVRRFGGKVEDYLEIHNFFDQSKAGYCFSLHRGMLHHSEGIFLCEKFFGQVIKNSDGKLVPVRVIGEQHVMEDLGRIPSLKDWLKCIKPEPWMIHTPNRLPEIKTEEKRGELS